MDSKRIYHFGDGTADGNSALKSLLGGKGANLAEMGNLGIPVPPGFTLTTEICLHFVKNDGAYPPEFEGEVDGHIQRLEGQLGRRFGDEADPLLLSVRSGAAVSMPGMMDTILNLGLNDQTVKGLARVSGDGRFAYDSYRRFVQMYGDVVLNVPRHLMEEQIDLVKAEKGYERDTDLSAEDWTRLVGLFKGVIAEHTGTAFPESPKDQLWGAIGAVFSSWNNKRAIDYRKIQNIPDDLGTAVNIQAMVFGNKGKASGTGVAFTRDPNTGENVFFGEYLLNAQGEDVVAGIRTPQSIRRRQEVGDQSLEATMPEVYGELERIYKHLELHYKDMLDLEFTVEEGCLWMLQVRVGKRTARAAVRIAADMVSEGLIDMTTALGRVSTDQVEQLLHPTLEDAGAAESIVTGLPASPGAVSGFVVFDPAEASRRGEEGEDIILVRPETSPEDVMAMKMSRGILTSTGGMTSHAAVVGRGMGKTCVVGCQGIRIDERAGQFSVGELVVKAGDVITLDGSTGDVFLGELPTKPGDIDDPYLGQLLSAADDLSKLDVWGNADTPEDAKMARSFGAQGIGLCRTEHMFFHADRLSIVREMILSKGDVAVLGRALEQLEAFQTEDFKGILEAMAGLPVTIRLLDPPLHEFLPREEADIESLAKSLGLSREEIAHRIEALTESNPMLGHRGCRLGVSNPEIYEMQVRALVKAAVSLHRRGLDVYPEIMIPLVSEAAEVAFLRERVVAVATEVFEAAGCEVPYTVGTMIELPRAALTARDIAEHADFFSFGTNDLTQTTYGISRDDMASFAFPYYQRGVWVEDPFKSLDQRGVGRLVEMGLTEGRQTRPSLKVGICGEHGGDPSSIAFCSKLGLSYVSCSPYRVPVARLAAAHAAIAQEAQ